jgi:hypothetical protein
VQHCARQGCGLPFSSYFTPALLTHLKLAPKQLLSQFNPVTRAREELNAEEILGSLMRMILDSGARDSLPEAFIRLLVQLDAAQREREVTDPGPIGD